jgi:NAD(P)-dependent dehydrogenase (short-subunit alcohol dehydrogenase family)
VENQLLIGKTAVIFGAGGGLGRQVAQRFADMGATVHASNRTLEKMAGLTNMYQTRAIDALDEMAVENFLDEVVEISGRIDIAVNLVATDHAAFNHGKPATEVSLDQFLIPARLITGSQFITAKAAYKHMARQKSGVIVFITSTLAKVGSPWSTAMAASHAATEGLVKSLATEWGADGVRVVGVRSEAMPDTPTIDYTFTAMGRNIGLSRDEMQSFVEQNKTALKRLPSTRETADVLAFAASDMAGYMTGTMLNQSGGHILE